MDKEAKKWHKAVKKLTKYKKIYGNSKELI